DDDDLVGPARVASREDEPIIREINRSDRWVNRTPPLGAKGAEGGDWLAVGSDDPGPEGHTFTEGDLDGARLAPIRHLHGNGTVREHSPPFNSIPLELGADVVVSRLNEEVPLARQSRRYEPPGGIGEDRAITPGRIAGIGIARLGTVDYRGA